MYYTLENFIDYCDEMMIANEDGMNWDYLALPIAAPVLAVKTYVGAFFEKIKQILKTIFNKICEIINKFRHVNGIIISKSAMKIIDTIQKINSEYNNPNTDTAFKELQDYDMNRLDGYFEDLRNIDNCTNQFGIGSVKYNVNEINKTLRDSNAEIKTLLKNIEIVSKNPDTHEGGMSKEDYINYCKRKIFYYQNQVKLANILLSYK